MAYKLLIINPGSTSTKIGVYEGEKEILEETLRHSAEEILKYDTIFDQLDFRKEVILKVLKEKGIDINELDAVVILLKVKAFGIGTKKEKKQKNFCFR